MEPFTDHPDAVNPESRDLVRRFCTVNVNLNRSTRSLRLLDSAEQFTLDTPYGPVVAWDWEPGADERPVALLCHGWSDSAATWIALNAPLRDAGYRPIAFDQPAHGATAELTGVRETIFPRMMAATEALTRWILAREWSCSLIGHSIGALGAYLVACDNPVDALVCIAMPPAVPWFIDHFAETSGLTPEIRREFLMHLTHRFHQDQGTEARPDSMDSEKRTPAADLPVLMIQDAADREVPIQASHRTVAALRKAGSRPEVLDTGGLGHQLLLRNPVVLKKISDFLGTVERG